MAWLTKLGVGGALGVVIGLLLVTWIDPVTTGGAALLLLLCVAVISPIYGLVATWISRREDGTD